MACTYRTGAMIHQRRNYTRRAHTMRAIVECLTRSYEGLPLDRLAEAHHTLSQSATERIVKRLAIRGLVRQPSAGTWSASAPLRHPVQLVEEEEIV
jgi:hypothetical protein